MNRCAVIRAGVWAADWAYACGSLDPSHARRARMFVGSDFVPTGSGRRPNLLWFRPLVERVRKMLDDVGRERGRRLVLSVRPPSNGGNPPPTPETARQRGCDVPAWVKNGWVDFVAVFEFLLDRGDLPIDKWKQAIATVPI